MALAEHRRVPFPDISLPPGYAISSTTELCEGGGSPHWMCDAGATGARTAVAVKIPPNRSPRDAVEELSKDFARHGFQMSRRLQLPRALTARSNVGVVQASCGEEGCLAALPGDSLSAVTVVYFPGIQ